MVKTVTKSDYESGQRGFYTLIPGTETLAQGYSNINRKIVAKLKLIIAAMESDGYWPEKFYVHLLKNYDCKVYGVGVPLPKESEEQEK